MKKTRFLLAAIAAVIAAALPFFPAAPAPAKAAGAEYAVVSESGVYLYANKSMAEADKLCILPKTYYVLIDSELSDCYSVSYMDGERDGGYGKITGYVKKEQVLLKQPEAKPYYFAKTLTPSGTPKLRVSSPDDPDYILIAANQPICYYGSDTDARGNAYYYVLAAGRLGYVAASEIEPFTIPDHPDSIPPPSPSPSPNPSGQPSGSDATTVTPGGTNDKMQIFLIIAICIPAIIIVILLFRGSGKPPKSRYADLYSRDNVPPHDRDHYDDTPR